MEVFYINYYRARNNPDGHVTAAIMPTLEKAIQQQEQTDNSRNQHKETIARIRVTPICVEGQFDV